MLHVHAGRSRVTLDLPDFFNFTINIRIAWVRVRQNAVNAVQGKFCEASWKNHRGIFWVSGWSLRIFERGHGSQEIVIAWKFDGWQSNCLARCIPRGGQRGRGFESAAPHTWISVVVVPAWFIGLYSLCISQPRLVTYENTFKQRAKFSNLSLQLNTLVSFVSFIPEYVKSIIDNKIVHKFRVWLSYFSTYRNNRIFCIFYLFLLFHFDPE